MTRAEKLEALVQKAIDGDYKPDGIDDVTNFKATIRNGQAWVRWFNNEGAEVIQDVEHVIFNHDFALILFGEETERLWLCPSCGYNIEWYKHNETQTHCPSDGRKLKDVTRVVEYGDHPWMEHLQQAVISEQPIDYMYEVVFDLGE